MAQMSGLRNVHEWLPQHVQPDVGAPLAFADPTVEAT
jgi:hypothetical protein